MLFIIYPFIENKDKINKPVYLGTIFTALIILLSTVISIGYFSPLDLDKTDWAVLFLFKSVSFTFIERFDYIVVVEWLMIVIPTITLYMWAITYGIKRLYRSEERRVGKECRYWRGQNQERKKEKKNVYTSART